MTCQACGSRLAPDEAFCRTCGTAVSVPQPQAPLPPQSTPAPPPPPVIALHEEPRRTAESLDEPARSNPLFVLVAGNWVGAALVAVTTVLVAVGLACGVAVGSSGNGIGTGPVLEYAAAIAGTTFGAALHGHASGGSTMVRQMPLVLTIVSMGVGCLLFRVVTRGYPRPAEALGDAIRAALLLSLLMLLVGLYPAGHGHDLADPVAQRLLPGTAPSTYQAHARATFGWALGPRQWC